MTEVEEKLREIILQAWNDGNMDLEDKFGDFLSRAARAIKKAGYKSPEEVKKVVQSWQDAYAFPDKWAKANGYAQLAEVQTLPENPFHSEDGAMPTAWYAAVESYKELLTSWRKIKGYKDETAEKKR